MNIQATTEKEFFERSGIYEKAMRELDALIRKEAPSLLPEMVSGMSISMLGYGMTPYRYASGKEGIWPLIAIAPQKNYASLYICALKDGTYYAEYYKDQLGKVSCGKSCIRFKKLEDLDLATVRKMISEVASAHSAGKVQFGM